MSTQVVHVAEPGFGPSWLTDFVRQWLESWHDALRIYARANRRAEDPDIAHWWGERTSVGLLASAAWRLGREDTVALTEYDVDRREGGEGQARCDLWIVREGHTVSAEAKQVWPAFSMNGDTGDSARVKECLAWLKEARRDVRRILPKDQGETGLAVCFVTPEMSRTALKTAAFEVFSERATLFWHALEEECRRLNNVAFARYECAEDEYEAAMDKETDHVYPGVAVIVTRTW